MILNKLKNWNSRIYCTISYSHTKDIKKKLTSFKTIKELTFKTLKDLEQFYLNNEYPKTSSNLANLINLQIINKIPNLILANKESIKWISIFYHI